MKLKKLLIVFIVFLVNHSAGWCDLPNKSEVMGLFYKANAAYKSNEYSEALSLYQQIVDAGFSSPAVYYNMGNCSLKLGKVGPSLLWYERALRLSPRDADVLANYGYAKAMIKNLQPPERKEFFQRIFIHLSLVTSDEIVLILIGLVIAGTVVILLGLFLHWRFKKTIVFLSVVVLLFVFHVFALVIKFKEMRGESVVLQTTEVKYEPDSTGTTHYTAYEGWKVRFLRESEGWVKIERLDGLQGWVPTDKLEKI